MKRAPMLKIICRCPAIKYRKWKRKSLDIKKYELNKYSLLCACIAAFASVCTTIIVHNDTVASLAANVRPWIQIDYITVSDLTISNNELITNIEAHYHNIGHSPVTGIILRATSNPFRSGPSDALAQCLTNSEMDKLGPKSVFPAEEGSDAYNLHLKNIDQIDRERLRDKIYGVLGLSGCISYTFEGSSDVHHTTFSATMFTKDGRGIDYFSTGSVDPSNLVITIEKMVGTVAN
jgi:hypothetical protein